jgi:aminoglycoside phosphotransferase (APT) family kinase protein
MDGDAAVKTQPAFFDHLRVVGCNDGVELLAANHRRWKRGPGVCMTSLHRDRDVRNLVVAKLRDYHVDSVVLLGEGLDNVVYVVNDELIVRFSKESNPEQRAVRVQREAAVLAAVADVVPVAVPEVRFTVVEQGCLAYSRLPGVPLLIRPRQQRLTHAASIAAMLGRVLSVIHAMPAGRLTDLLETDDQQPAGWLRDAAETYRTIMPHVPSSHRRAVEAFLAAAPPAEGYALMFSHNDLGIEHVLVDPGTSTVTGIIDWSDAALADPAYDFGLLYRDLGPRALEVAIGSYRTDREGLDSLRQRAVFYARCSVFEDLAYGIQLRRECYVDLSLAALDWLFLS